MSEILAIWDRAGYYYRNGSDSTFYSLFHQQNSVYVSCPSHPSYGFYCGSVCKFYVSRQQRFQGYVQWIERNILGPLYSFWDCRHHWRAARNVTFKCHMQLKHGKCTMSLITRNCREQHYTYMSFGSFEMDFLFD